MTHPWDQTLRQFVDTVVRYYGIEMVVLSLPPGGSILASGGRIYPLPGIEEDDLLSPDVQKAICDLFNLPRSDFHLDSDPED